MLASSTSAIVASQFTEALAGRRAASSRIRSIRRTWFRWSNCAGRRGHRRRRALRAREVFESVGQVPIDVKREIDGFILNRLQVALLTEAFRLVQEGYVSPQDLDHTIRDGLGLRWAFMGPFETIELNAPGGIADYCRRYTHWFRRYVADLPPPSVWDEAAWQQAAAAWGPAPSAEQIADKSRWRDRRLAALRRAQARAEAISVKLKRSSSTRSSPMAPPPRRSNAKSSSPAR